MASVVKDDDDNDYDDSGFRRLGNDMMAYALSFCDASDLFCLLETSFSHFSIPIGMWYDITMTDLPDVEIPNACLRFFASLTHLCFCWLRDMDMYVCMCVFYDDALLVCRIQHRYR